MLRALRISFAFCLLLSCEAANAQEGPRNICFTWQGDTSATITLNFQSFGEKALAARVHWDTEPRDGALAAYRHRADAQVSAIPGLTGRWVYRAELRSLEPGGAIYLCIGEGARAVSRELKVRTMPRDDRPIRFVTGGDMGTDPAVRTLLRHAAAASPDFALIGGDIAYENGKLENVGRWDAWFAAYVEEMVRPDGFAIPAVLAIGNHEVDGSFLRPKENAPFYFGFFAQGGESYFERRFGANLACCVLDSSHIAAHGEEQARWLEGALRAQREVPHRIAIYHVPLYPSHREFEGPFSALGRQHWAPLFERHGLDIAFENHDHTFKRTPPLRAGAPAEGGVVYLGDGCMGQAPRTVQWGGRSYLETQAALRHYWQVDVDRERMICRAIDEQGRVFDVHPEDAPGAAEAALVFSQMEMRYGWPAAWVDVVPFPVPPKEWKQGATRVRLANRSGVALELKASLAKAPKDAQLTFPKDARLAPGAQIELPIEVELREPAASAQLVLALRIEGRGVEASGRKILFSSDFPLRFER